MANSLVPAFVKINSVSAFAPHVQILPTNQWNDGAGDGDFEAHSGSPIAAATMIAALIDAMKEFFPASYQFNSYEIWTQATPDDLPVLRRATNISEVGVLSPVGLQIKATQATWSFKTTEGGVSKVVMLDVGVSSFDRISSADVSAEETAFIDEWTGVGNAWAGRDNGRPFFFQQISYTLNEKLRREYHLT